MSAENSVDSTTERIENLTVEAPAVSEVPKKDFSALFTSIHPLSTGWSLWYIKPQTSGLKENWKDLVSEVISFDTVEDFWGVYNNIPKASELPIKGDYALFRKGIKPEWEEEENKDGGKWSYVFNKTIKQAIDEKWLNIVLGSIGETLEEDEEESVVTGLFLNIRKNGVRVELWTKISEDEEKLKIIGSRFKELLGVTANVEFTKHSESMNKGASRDAKYTV
ncbi:translation initiation factor eIF4e [Nadsonia fulvescens var. elongata DSM 6958]|uniref:Translation initiation factor eIF4e n=1 Tax=Nadsonia fulvescens var. elongata DSM 6958 TaxID=857566 RepID=A0A1E3PGW2_9ASCO|nr:translation initiation factor eIF4e [Nadsonia fulvescens var. elongata DSM 6958]